MTRATRTTCSPTPHTAAYTLRQTLRQTSQFLTRRLAADTRRTTNGGNPGQAVATAEEQLQLARDAAEQLHHHLERAQQATTHPATEQDEGIS